MIDVSLVIPAYNVEKYIGQCLDSIVNQTLKNIEIICVNDGSSDNTLSILKQYQSRDDRIIIINQENRGPGAARNAGLEKATGKYFQFIDSDDDLELNALETLFNIAEEKDTDLIIFKFKTYDDETGKTIDSDYYEMPKVRNMVQDNIFTYKQVKPELFNMAVSPIKFYRLDLLKDIRYPEDIYFEDNVFFLEVMLNSERIYFYDEYLYNRRMRPGSIVTSNFEKYLDTIDISNMLFDVCRKSGCYDELKQYLYPRKINNTFYIMKLIEAEDIKEKFFDKLKADFIQQRETFENDDFFNNELNERTRHIFYSGIESDTWKEFEYSNMLFDLNNDYNKLSKKNKELSSEINELKKENEHLKSTKAYKVWKKYSKLKS